ncbi:MAG: FAD-dependent oxidoreductase, partial [Acidobacteriota bacterium]|nr:FAD-dependent oxidoreductase [Acidobacteriota bacterium]
GGIIGMSIAWRLARRRLQVMVLDTGAIGGEASWAGAGMLAPGGEIEQRSAWSDFALESLQLYPAFVEELESESGLKIDFRHSGAQDLAFNEAEWDELTARAARQSALGIASSPIPGEQALFYPGDAIVDPRDVVQSLRCACLARGVEIREHEAVTRVEAHRSGQDVDVHSARGRYTAGSAVLSAGAWSGSAPLFIDDRPCPIPRSFPIRGHLLGYELPPHSLGPILRHGHTYILQRASGFTIAGSSTENAGFNRDIDPAVVADIHRRAVRILPQLSNPTPWLGFRPATESLTPEIGRVPNSNVWLAYGHYRNGILLAPATARRIARDITSSSETGWFSPAANR